MSPSFPQRFFARGNDGGAYYVTQVDATSTLWWFGEIRDFNWAHVFRGRLSRGDARNDRWEGRFIDVPKGLTCGHGELDWQMRPILPWFSTIVRTGRRGERNAFGGTELMPIGVPDPPPIPVTRQVPGYVGNGLENITGVWTGNDQGTYYIREVAGTRAVAWVGEHPEAEPDVSDTSGRHWVNVFMGTRTGSAIEGEWTDVNKGEVNRSGTLSLVLLSPNLLVVQRQDGGFGGTRFFRTSNLYVTVRWLSLQVVDQQEWFFEADEPYFLALIALMDGATVDLLNRAASTANFEHSFVGPMLQANVGAGRVVDLSSLPSREIEIRPIPGDRVESAHPVLAIALRGAEQDESSDRWRTDRLQNWISVAGAEVNRVLQQTGDVEFETNVARWHETFSWYNEDDLFGLDSTGFTFRQLEALAGASTTRVFHLRGRDVHYDVTAAIAVRRVRGTCAP